MYKFVTVSLVRAPSIVSEKVRDVKLVFLDTSRANESIPTLSEPAVHDTTTCDTVVSWPLTGSIVSGRGAWVSTTNPRAVECALTLPRSSIARTCQKYVSL